MIAECSTQRTQKEADVNYGLPLLGASSAAGNAVSGDVNTRELDDNKHRETEHGNNSTSTNGREFNSESIK